MSSLNQIKPRFFYSADYFGGKVIIYLQVIHRTDFYNLTLVALESHGYVLFFKSFICHEIKILSSLKGSLKIQGLLFKNFDCSLALLSSRGFHAYASSKIHALEYSYLEEQFHEYSI